MRRDCLLYLCDRPIPYLTAWRWQKQLVEDRKQARREGKDLSDVLLLLEHPTVYTLGQGSSLVLMIPVLSAIALSVVVKSPTMRSGS